MFCQTLGAGRSQPTTRGHAGDHKAMYARRSRFINRIVFCELVWVLESAYGYPKDTIVAVLEKLLRTSQLKVEDAQSTWTAFRMYQKGKADYSDCLLGATSRIAGCDSTVTFDQAAIKLQGFQPL